MRLPFEGSATASATVSVWLQRSGVIRVESAGTVAIVVLKVVFCESPPPSILALQRCKYMLAQIAFTVATVVLGEVNSVRVRQSNREGFFED